MRRPRTAAEQPCPALPHRHVPGRRWRCCRWRPGRCSPSCGGGASPCRCSASSSRPTEASWWVPRCSLPACQGRCLLPPASSLVWAQQPQPQHCAPAPRKERQPKAWLPQGLNIGGGGGGTREIRVRLRPAGRESDFLHYESVLKTLLHEVWGGRRGGVRHESGGVCTPSRPPAPIALLHSSPSLPPSPTQLVHNHIS